MCCYLGQSSSVQQTGVFAWRPDPWILSLASALNKYAHLSSQPANPFVVRPGQLHIALGVDHRGVPQPLL